MDPTPELRRRRVFAGISLIAAPLAIGVAYLIAPSLHRNAVDQVTAIAAAPGRLELGVIVGTFGIALSVFVAIGLAHLLREEQPWLGQIGAVLAVTGLVLYTLTLGALVMASGAAAMDTTSAATAWENTVGGPVMILAGVGLAVGGVGFLLLALGLIIAHTAPLWSSYGLGLGTIVLVVAALAASTPWAVVGAVVLFLGLAPLGYEIIAEPDEAWEHPVHFEGMHPMPG